MLKSMIRSALSGPERCHLVLEYGRGQAVRRIDSSGLMKRFVARTERYEGDGVPPSTRRSPITQRKSIDASANPIHRDMKNPRHSTASTDRHTNLTMPVTDNLANAVMVSRPQAKLKANRISLQFESQKATSTCAITNTFVEIDNGNRYHLDGSPVTGNRADGFRTHSSNGNPLNGPTRRSMSTARETYWLANTRGTKYLRIDLKKPNASNNIAATGKRGRAGEWWTRETGRTQCRERHIAIDVDATCGRL